MRGTVHNTNGNSTGVRIMFYPGSMGGGRGGEHNTCGNFRGVGVIFVFKNWKLQERGGSLREIPSMVRVWIFSGTTHFSLYLDSMVVSKYMNMKVIDIKKTSNKSDGFLVHST